MYSYRKDYTKTIPHHMARLSHQRRQLLQISLFLTFYDYGSIYI
jgi:hypothetical protein